jgi:hypothetical protein
MSGNFLPLQPPLPQVGAVLNLDTELDSYLRSPDLYRGSKHWKLDGSCVLVGRRQANGPDCVLTVRHLLEKHSQSAVFLPYEGLFQIDQDGLEWEKKEKEKPSSESNAEPQDPGDYLVLAPLVDGIGKAARLQHSLPLQPKKIYKRSCHVLACGYGDWPGTSLHGDRGLQQQHQVDIRASDATSEPRWDHYDNLDLCWSSSENQGRLLGSGNSGGPMLWQVDDGYAFVGINRERKGDQQIGSWIGDQRETWLKIPSGGWVAEPPKSTHYHPLVVEKGGGQVLTLRRPKSATQVKATLNATDGLRLQMTLAPLADAAGILERARTDNAASGRFLYRELPVEDVGDVAIAIAPVASAPPRAPRVLAQLCVLFV